MNPISKLAKLPRPEDGLRAVVEHAPQAEAFAATWIERVRPFLVQAYRLRRRIATIAVAVVAVSLFVHVMFGANGMVVYKQKRTEFQSLQTEIDGLQKENDRYTGQIQSLKTDPKTIEKEAREQLHYARPGEVIYVAPAPLATDRPANNAARK